MSRVLLAVGTVVGLLAGAGIAWAAWTSSGPGSVTARAATLGTTTATASAWTCGAGAAASRFAAGTGGVEAFPGQVVVITTTTPTARAATTTTTPAAPTTTTTAAAPTTSGSASGSSVAPTTTTVAPTTSTTGVVTGLGASATTLSWTAAIAATGYQYQAATTADFAAPVAAGATGALSATVTVRAVLRTTVYLRVRATAWAWTGPWSPTVTTTAGPCLV